MDWSVILAHGDFLLSAAFVGFCSSLHFLFAVQIPRNATYGVSVLYVAWHGIAEYTDAVIYLYRHQRHGSRYCSDTHELGAIVTATCYLLSSIQPDLVTRAPLRPRPTCRHVAI